MRRLLPLVVLALLAAACDKPTSIQFDPSDAIAFESTESKPLPEIVVRTKRGKRVQGGPPANVTIEPQGIVAFEGGQLVPKGNGKATVTASLPELSPATLEVSVNIVDDVRLACPNPCAIGVGGRILITSSTHGFGQATQREIVWSSSNPNVAAVASDGTVSGVASGTATIKAAAGGKEASIDVVVHAPLDELRLFCPSPPFVVVARKRGDSVPAARQACEVGEGESLKLLLQGAEGLNVMTPVASWSSSSPASVLVIDGEIRGGSVGSATVSAVVADLKTEMPFLVKSARAPVCSDPLGYGIDAPVAFKIERDGAVAAAGKSDFQCATPAAAACLKDAVADIEKAGQTGPVELVAVTTHHALQETARRCCCKPKA